MCCGRFATCVRGDALWKQCRDEPSSRGSLGRTPVRCSLERRSKRTFDSGRRGVLDELCGLGHEHLDDLHVGVEVGEPLRLRLRRRQGRRRRRLGRRVAHALRELVRALSGGGQTLLGDDAQRVGLVGRVDEVLDVLRPVRHGLVDGRRRRLHEARADLLGRPVLLRLGLVDGGRRRLDVDVEDFAGRRHVEAIIVLLLVAREGHGLVWVHLEDGHRDGAALALGQPEHFPGSSRKMSRRCSRLEASQ